MTQTSAQLRCATTGGVALILAAVIACSSASPGMTFPRAPTTERAEHGRITLRYRPTHKYYTISDQATIELETDSIPRTLKILRTGFASLHIRQLDSNTIAAQITVDSLSFNQENPSIPELPQLHVGTSTFSATISPTGQILHINTPPEGDCGATTYVSSIARSLLIPLLPVLQRDARWTEASNDTLCLLGITGQATVISSYQVTVLPSSATQEPIELTEESTADFHGNIFPGSTITALTARANRKTRIAIDTHSVTLVTSVSETESHIVVTTANGRALFAQRLHRKIEQQL